MYHCNAIKPIFTNLIVETGHHGTVQLTNHDYLLCMLEPGGGGWLMCANPQGLGQEVPSMSGPKAAGGALGAQAQGGWGAEVRGALSNEGLQSLKP